MSASAISVEGPAHDLASALDVVSDEVLGRFDGPMEKARGLPNEAFTSWASRKAR